MLDLPALPSPHRSPAPAPPLSTDHAQVNTALGAILRSSAARRLPCGVYGSFGWSGEAVDIIEGRLKVLRQAP